MSHDDLAQQVLHGIEMARDPRNAHVRGPNDLRVTTVYSPWLLQICRVCHHTFREHDGVRPDPNASQRMVHCDEQTLQICARPARGAISAPTLAAVPSEAIREAFLRGLQAHWQPAGGVSTVLVLPRSALIGRRCPICRHTVRPGDTVVLCPCGRNCGGVFHQDPLQHLTCWDNWNRGKTPTHCAFTGASFLRPLEETP